MRRKSLIVKRKVEKKKLSFNNPRIEKLYIKFKGIVYKNIKKESFAVAVSGGPDSLCLAYFGKIYLSELENKVHFLIVNHKLRKESDKESLRVKKILEKKGITAKILSWKGKIPKSNIQRKARDMRYSLLSDYCYKKNIKFLMTAHHLDDQIENFFIRLLRGSGLAGLSSMEENIAYNDNLKIIRPLLDFKKKDLENITLSFFN